MIVYVYPADAYGCGHYRLIWPGLALRSQGYDVRVIPPTSRQGISGEFERGTNRLIDLKVPDDADVIVLQRVTLAPLAAGVALLREQKRPVGVVVDMDDDLRSIHPSNPAFAAMHKKMGYKIHSADNAMSACLQATVITVSTAALLPIYAPHGRGVVLHNRVPASYLDIPHQDSAAIGWAGSVHSHPDDLHEVGPAVARLLREGHTYRGAGPPEGLQSALMLDEEPSVTGSLDLDKWPYGVAEIGVGIAPLADTGFNAAKCLDESTRVATERGLLPIGEIEVGDRVWCDGHWRVVEGTRRELPTIGVLVTTNSGRQIRLTKEHRLYGAGAWRHAGDLQPGDQVSLASDETGQTVLQSAPWPSDGRSSRGSHDRQAFVDAEDVPTVRITERWGRFLGLFAGDGSVGGSGTAVSIHCDGIDPDLIDLVADDFRAFGLWPVVNRATTYDGTLLRRRYVSASSTHFLRFLRSLGVAQGKRRVVAVPEIIWRSPRSVMAAFLAGLFEADGTSGSTNNPAAPSMMTKHRQLGLDVQRMLTAFGIESWLSERWLRAQTGPMRQYWHLRLRRAGADLFVKEIGFLSERKRAALAVVTGRKHSNAYRPQTWTDTVAAVEPCWVTPVDLQVEGAIFAAAGFVSHNSWLKPLEMSAVGVPWVGSPRAEYLRLHRDTGAGVLAKSRGEWYRELRRLCTDEAWRLERSEAGRAAAAANTVEGHAWRWMEVWERAAAEAKRAAPAFGKPLGG